MEHSDGHPSGPLHSSSDGSLTPALIRALRGEQTRAAFAARLGITEQTVYRWELSPTAKEARRPRGEVRARLLALLAGPSRTDEDALVPPAPPALPSRDLRDDTGAILASLLRALSGELRRSHHELLTAATRADTSRDGRALAQAGLAILEGLFHCDGQRALASIGGFLATIDTYADAVRPWLHASAALTFAQADARLLDVGRVQAHGGAIRLDAHPEAWLVAWLAGLSVAFATSDFDLVRQVLARLGPDAPSGMPPLLDLHIDESRALAALVNGQHAVAAGRFRAVAGTAHALGHAAVEARALACLAMRQLDDLAAPEQVLAGARASRQIANDARLGYGIHTFLALRAEGEALLRLGLVDELPALLEAIAHAHDEAGFEATPAGQLVARVAMLQGRHADLFAQAERLESCDVPSLASLARGQAAFMRGLGHLA